ncbi:MAG: hypothetical protein N2645_10920 [Clostridia bacterium]|nr:hypothetical protein [Clostridia bacterium]
MKLRRITGLSMFLVALMLLVNVCAAFAAAPGNFTLTGVGGDNIVTLNWTASQGAVSYDVYRLNIFSGWTVIAYNVTSTSYSMTAVNGNTYTFFVKARSADGEQTQSNQVNVTAAATPGTASVSNNNYSNSRNYTVSWNLWYGNNASKWYLVENGTVVYTGTLVENTPNAQSGSYSFSNKAPGTYTYKVILENSYGKQSESAANVVTVN